VTGKPDENCMTSLHSMRLLLLAPRLCLFTVLLTAIDIPFN